MNMEPTCECEGAGTDHHIEKIRNGRAIIWCTACERLVRYVKQATPTGGDHVRVVERHDYAAQPGTVTNTVTGTIFGPCIDCGVVMTFPSNQILPMKCLPCACDGTPLEPLMDALKAAWDHVPPAGYLPDKTPWLQPLINAVSAIVNPSGIVIPVEGIDFVSALASGKPMRRRKWLHHPPTDEKSAEQIRTLSEHWWLYLSPVPGVAKVGDKPVLVSAWFNLVSCERVMLTREDYAANDWELL